MKMARATIRPRRKSGSRLASGFMLLLFCIRPPAVEAAEWSVNEVHFLYGTLDAPGFAGGGNADTAVLTFQHSSAWKYGSNFLFIDYSTDNKEDGINDEDFYGEWYAYFSMGKITGWDLMVGPLADLSLVAGINLGADANVRKFLPGIALHWNVPGFAFLNTQLEAYIDDSEGIGSGGAPRESDSFIINVNWAYPFSISQAKVSIEGYVDLIGERDNELGSETSWWILGQPQIRLDLGHLLYGMANKLFIGCELEFWINKLGDPDVDELAPQALVVWRF
jgi:nucleoside-specific outer membrane channel protein Tsx